MDNEDELIKSDIGNLLLWIKKYSPEAIYPYQELLLNSLRLITNRKFRQEIKDIREKLKVPTSWFDNNKNKDNYNEWLKWSNKFVGNKPRQWLVDDFVRELCKNYKLSHKRYGEFIESYTLFNSMYPGKPIMFQNILAKDEFRYKARIEADYGEGASPRGGYIRFFKNTSINKLKKFIESNKEIIDEIKEHISDYPHKRIRKPDIFKRDLEVYILHLIGYDSTKIAEEILGEYESKYSEEPPIQEKEIYALDNNNINQIIGEIKREIRKSQDIKSIRKT